MEKSSENLNSYKIFQKDIKNIITKIRHNQQPERKLWKSVRIAKKKKGILKNKERLGDIWDNIKHTNSHIIGFSEGEKRERGRKVIGKK